ncbi:T9SS type A sorting domain-containing protein [Chryseobacterium arthrosphaerae]|uniref:T9SS type A sorting domain-containing protein n=1 Tax=Chryseobacterium arthrosphaerae TaxID=651561 RepID=UPI003D34E7CA
MKRIFLISSLILAGKVLNAQQAPSIEWAVCLGGIGFESAATNFNNAGEFGLQVLRTPDGGYVVAGSTDANSGYVTGVHGNNPDMWVVKTDQNGNFQWQKALGGSGFDEAAAITLTSDGGYLLAGSSTIDNGDVLNYFGATDVWIAKLDATGNKMWTNNMGSTGTEMAYSVQQTSDGGFIIAGTTSGNNYDVSGHHGIWSSYDMWIVKTNSTGNIEWQKCLGGDGNEVAYSVQQTSDGGYIVGGFSQTNNNGDVTGNHSYWDTNDWAYKPSRDAWVVKLNSTGAIQWQKSLGGSGEDVASSIQQTTDGGYILAGFSDSVNGDVTGNHGKHDFWITKINANGSLVWQKSLGGSKSDKAYSIKQTPDGGYVATGYSFSADGNVTDHHGTDTGHDYWVVRLNTSGDLMWSKSLGGTYGDTAFSLDLTPDGGYVVAGSTSSRDGDVVGLHQNVDATDFWLVKLGAGTLNTQDSKAATAISVYPNPIRDKAFFSENLNDIQVSTLEGSIVLTQSGGQYIDVQGLPASVYILKGVQKSGNMITKKIIKK